MIKVIISYALAGAGHFKAAQAIYDYLKEERSDLEIKIIDVLKHSTPALRVSYLFGYPFLVKYLQGIWRALFWVTQVKPFRPLIRGVIASLNRANTRAFAGLLIKENPGYIISTHFLTSEISAYLKRTGKINSRLITVITDFGVHPFWLCAGTDLYITASKASEELLIGEGVSLGKIRPFGIPVNPKFLKQYNKKELLEKFGLREGRFNVLVVTGSFGIGPIEKIIGLLHREAQILVVCARNHKLYRKLKEKNYPHCLIFGFIDNMQELMAVSDLIITKPGGMSISESLVMGLLPIFISPIPGQENENVRILLSRGIGIYPEGVEGIRDAILDFKNNPHKLIKLRQDIAGFKKPYVLRDISDVIR